MKIIETSRAAEAAAQSIKNVGDRDLEAYRDGFRLGFDRGRIVSKKAFDIIINEMPPSITIRDLEIILQNAGLTISEDLS